MVAGIIKSGLIQTYVINILFAYTRILFYLIVDVTPTLSL
jgi:hypothetical protein